MDGKSLTKGGQTVGVTVKKSVPKVSFDDIGGQEVAKRGLIEALQFIKDIEAARVLGIRPLKGFC